MQTYQYQPLPSSSSIRVLILYPAADTLSALECEIITNDRLAVLRSPDNKTFDAVSYVWGNGAHDIPLYCKSEGTYLYISAVVDEMLRSLRKGHKVRRLWVDAICLNQKDNQEKSIQVQQMGQIYHMANKVHIWLGPAAATTPLAFAFIRILVAKFEPLPGQAKDPTTAEILHTFEETFQHRNFQPVLSLLQMPWFTRRWTLQEGFLARDAIVRSGGVKMPWRWFIEGLTLMKKGSQELEQIKNDQNATYALDVLKTLKEPADLLSLLWTLHMSQCSDHRDRIYSLLGLAQNIDPVASDDGTVSSKLQADSNSKDGLPIPDYTLSADAVYRGFVGHCISADKFLQILIHIEAFGRLSEVNPKWSSWVPNWTTIRNMKRGSSTTTLGSLPVIRYLKGGVHYLDALNTIPSQVKFVHNFLYPRPTEYSDGNHRGLLVYGNTYKETLEVCSPWPESNDSDQLIKYLTDWIHQKAIVHISDWWLTPDKLEREVINRLRFLIFGTDFFGYATHNFFQTYQDEEICSKFDWDIEDVSGRRYKTGMKAFQPMANIVYPISQERRPYTPEQLYLKEHLDEKYNSCPLPTSKGQQELSDLIHDVSRMMREGKKQLIAALYGVHTCQRRRHWIAPSDFRMGDVITDLTYCGRIGVVLRPIDSSSEVYGRPAFQLIGIVWSLDLYQKPINEEEGILIL